MKAVFLSRGNLIHVPPFVKRSNSVGWDSHWATLSECKVDACGAVLHRLDQKALNLELPKVLSYAIASLNLRRLVRELSPDFVWAHYASSAGTAAWLSGARPYCVTIHGSDILEVSKSAHWRWILRRVLRSAFLVHCVSPSTADRAREIMGNDQRLLELAFGIDVSKIAFRPKLSSKPLHIVCTRSLEYDIYDVPTILRAVHLLKSEGILVKLSLYGRGKLKSALVEMVRSLGITDRVVFYDGYANDSVGELLSNHNVYVSSSHSDGASLSLMEAMAAGSYPVLSDIDANRDWVGHSNGKFFRVGDHVALAECFSNVADLRQKEILAAVSANRNVVEERANRTMNLDRLFQEISLRL